MFSAFLIQATGGSMLSSTDQSTDKLGFDVYMAGIGVQQAGLLLFLSLAITFHRKVKKVDNIRPTGWAGLLYVVYAIILLITVCVPFSLSVFSMQPLTGSQARIVFRFVEFSSGFDSAIPTHEAYFYCLDAVPMFTAIFLFNAFHPGRALVGSESEFPKMSKQQKKEDKAQKKEAKRQKKEEKKQRKKGVLSEKQESSGEPSTPDGMEQV